MAAREARLRPFWVGFAHRQLRCDVDRNDGQSRPLLQVRARTLNGTLRETFQRWRRAMTPASSLALS
jgi:hypothetical protein